MPHGSTKFEVKQGGDAQWYWHLVRGNGEIVCHSEGYSREADAWRAAYDMPAWANVATFANRD